MANRLQFKRGNSSPLAGSLSPAEPGYDLSSDLLYIGNDSGDVQIIGGKSYVDRVDQFLNAVGDLTVDRNADITGTIGVTGAATFESSVTLTAGNLDLTAGNLTIAAGTFQIGGTSAISQILDEDNLASNSSTALPTQRSVKKYVDDVLSLGTADLTVANLTATEDVQIDRNLNVTGLSTFAGNSQFASNVDIDGTLDVQLGANFQAGITVAGAADLNSTLDVQGDANFQASVDVGVDARVAGNMRVAGLSTFIGDVDVDGAADIQGNLNLQSELDVAQAARFASTLDVTGISTFNGALDVNSTSNFQGDVQLQSNLDVDGTADIQGNANLQASLDVGVDARVAGNIRVAGLSTFIGNVDVDGELDVAQAANFQSGVTVAGAADLNNTLNVQGAATFQDTVRIEGNLEVAGTATRIDFEVRDVAIEDRLLELGMEAGAAPTAATTWDLGLALNYHDGTAKKAAVVWTDNTGFNLAAQVTESVTSGANDPQIAVDQFAELGISGLHIGDVTGGNANTVINSEQDASFTELYIGAPIDTAANKFASFDGTFVQLENTAFDGGTW